MPMNVHSPSLGIGAAIAVISILVVFFVLDFDVSENDNPSAKINLDDIQNKQKEAIVK